MTRAWRALVRRPIFSLVVIMTIGSGVGITTALFSIVDSVLVRPLPFPDGDQLVSLNEANPASRARAALIAPARMDDWNRLSRTFEVISGSYFENQTDTSGPEPERLAGRRVTPRYFDVFGMAPLAGRTFVADEERFGGPTAAVISEGLWARRFGRNPNAVGKRLTIGGRGYTIVGVMPQTFTNATIDVWVPAQVAPGLMKIRDARFLSGVGRMKPGVTLQQARSDLDRIQRQLGEQYPQTDKDWGVQILDLKEARIGEYRKGLLLIFGAVSLLLLIAIANVAGLMLVQLRHRAGEFAIRSALGASRRQVVGAVMREVAILCIAGCIFGAALAKVMIGGFVAGFATIPRMAEVGLDGRALAFAAVASVAAAALFGLLPILQSVRARLVPLLSLEGRGVLGSRHGLQRALVVAQIALSVLLAGAAGLLLRSYDALTKVSTGFNTDDTITFHVGAAWDEDRVKVGQLQTQLVTELQQLPGVREAGFTNFLPATGATLRYQVHVDGLSGTDANGLLTVGSRSVSPGYLRALQIPLVAGEFCPEVHPGGAGPRAAMVNRQFVDVYAGGANIIGRNLTIAEGGSTWRIVGIVGDVIEDGPSAPFAPYAYVCLPAGGWPDPEYVVRATGSPQVAIAGLRQLVRRLDPNRPLFGIRPVEEIIGESLEQPRLNARLLALFAGAALGLAALGLYGLLTLVVAERRRELGVRMALGASQSAVMSLVVSGAGRLVAIGLGAGLVLTFVSGSVLRGLLFGVTAHDPGALTLSVLALVLVSVVAIAIPARQAARVNPIDAIRNS